MKVVAIRKGEQTTSKTVEASQKTIDGLPLNSGKRRVEGIPGLYVRCRDKTKSFFIQRRFEGRLG